MNPPASFTRYPSLNRRDCEAMVASLDVCIMILEAKPAVLSASELRIKSMLSTLRGELKHHALQLDASEAPFEAERRAER